MSAPREDFAIVMRTFWPVSPVVGEGMMQVSENLSRDFRCRIITQDQQNLKVEAKKFNRGRQLLFSPIRAFSNSSSNMLFRLLDLIWFAVSVFLVLIIRRPRVVYVATDPPILVPLVVAVYSKLSRARYIYHVQDIHPEATAVVYSNFKKINFIYQLIRKIDAWVVRNASKVITLTTEMADSLKQRGEVKSKNIVFINNPAATMPADKIDTKYDYSFVGNAGRLQLIPLVIESIRKFLKEGGSKKFAFAGAGVMYKELQQLAREFPHNVQYFGKVSVEKATQITLASEWAMLPIEDNVCSYAFPSKASSYAVSGKKILAICSANTSVAKWVIQNKVGIVIDPSMEEIVKFYKQENCWLKKKNNIEIDSEKNEKNLYKYTVESFVDSMTGIILKVMKN